MSMSFNGESELARGILTTRLSEEPMYTEPVLGVYSGIAGKALQLLSQSLHRGEKPPSCLKKLISAEQHEDSRS